MTEVVTDRTVAIIQESEGLDEAEARRLAWRLAAAGLLKRPPRAPRQPKPPRPPRVEHGTPGAYERCRKRPEGSCRECRAAKRAYTEAWKDRKDPHRRKWGGRDHLTPLPGGGYAEREWKKLSPLQREALSDLVGQLQAHLRRHPEGMAVWQCRFSIHHHEITTYRALSRRGLLPERGHYPTERGCVLVGWANASGAETTPVRTEGVRPWQTDAASSPARTSPAPAHPRTSG